MLAAAGAGLFPDVPTAAAAMSHDVETLAGEPATRDLYDALFTRAYQPLYLALREITHVLSVLEQEGPPTSARHAAHEA
jgi:hypothetical protein